MEASRLRERREEEEEDSDLEAQNQVRAQNAKSPAFKNWVFFRIRAQIIHQAVNGPIFLG